MARFFLPAIIAIIALHRLSGTILVNKLLMTRQLIDRMINTRPQGFEEIVELGVAHHIDDWVVLIGY